MILKNGLRILNSFGKVSLLTSYPDNGTFIYVKVTLILALLITHEPVD